jgi:hypothetical protein
MDEAGRSNADRACPLRDCACASTWPEWVGLRRLHERTDERSDCRLRFADRAR